jgi:pimeloyl-ACP methyl ester carboxylesterase
MGFDPATLGDLYPFTPKRFTLPSGQTMSYLDEGSSGDSGHTFLMVHGNPTWSFYYRNLVKEFSPNARCIVPDHIGAGLSDKPQDYAYTVSTHIENLNALTEHLDLGNLTLVVHDWGGAIGMGWALKNAAKVRRLVILNTAAFRSKRIPFSINICRIPGFGALAIRGMNAFARAAVIRAAKTSLPKDVIRGYLGPYDSWANRIANLRFVQDIPLHPGIPSWPVLETIEAGLAQFKDRPMLICWGGEDFCFDDSFLATWRERFPDAQVHRFADAGHYVLEDAGERVIEHMRQFLAAVPENVPTNA